MGQQEGSEWPISSSVILSTAAAESVKTGHANFFQIKV